MAVISCGATSCFLSASLSGLKTLSKNQPVPFDPLPNRRLWDILAGAFVLKDLQNIWVFPITFDNMVCSRVCIYTGVYANTCLWCVCVGTPWKWTCFPPLWCEWMLWSVPCPSTGVWESPKYSFHRFLRLFCILWWKCLAVYLWWDRWSER